MRFGCFLEFVTIKSQEGSQFCRGFGGIGVILRYQLDMRTLGELSNDGGIYEDSDYQSIHNHQKDADCSLELSLCLSVFAIPGFGSTRTAVLWEELRALMDKLSSA